jgi:hypothetical protein
LNADAIIAIANTPHRLSRTQQAQVGGLKYVEAGETAFTHGAVKAGSWLAEHTDGVATSAGETFNVQVSLSDKSEVTIQLRKSTHSVTTISEDAVKTLGSLQMVGMKVVAKIPSEGTGAGRVFMYGRLQLQGGVLGTITFSPARVDLQKRGTFKFTAAGDATTPSSVASQPKEEKEAVHHSVWGKEGVDPALAYESSTSSHLVQPYAGQAEMEAQKSVTSPLHVALTVKVKRSSYTLMEFFKQRFAPLYNDHNGKKLQTIFVKCANSDDAPYITVKAEHSNGKPMEVATNKTEFEGEYQGISLQTYTPLSAAAATIGFPMNMGSHRVPVRYLVPWSSLSASLGGESPRLTFSGVPQVGTKAHPSVIARLRWDSFHATIASDTTVRARVAYQVSASVWQRLSVSGAIKKGELRMQLTAPKAASSWPHAFGLPALTLKDVQLRPVFDNSLRDCPGPCGVKGFFVEASATLGGMRTALKSAFFKDQFFTAYLDSVSPKTASWLRVGPADGYAFPVKGLKLPPHSISNFKISVPIGAMARVQLFNRALVLVRTRPALHRLNKVLRKLALKPIDGFECLDTTKPLLSQPSITKSRPGLPSTKAPKDTDVTEWSQVKALVPTTNTARQAAKEVSLWPKGCQHKRWMPIRVLALVPQAFDVRTKHKNAFRIKLRARVLGRILEAPISMPYSAVHAGKTLRGKLETFALTLLRRRLLQLLAQNLTKPTQSLSYEVKTVMSKGYRLHISIRPLRTAMKQLDRAMKASLRDVALRLSASDTTRVLTHKATGSFQGDFNKRLKVLKRDLLSANKKIANKVRDESAALQNRLNADTAPRLATLPRPTLPKLPANPIKSACGRNDLGSGPGVPLMVESRFGGTLASAMEKAGWTLEFSKDARIRRRVTSTLPVSKTKRLTGDTRQSSEDWHGAPGRAVDGNTNQNYHGGSCTHTHNWGHPWWRLQFDAEKEVDKVEVWNRADCCRSRLSGVQVIVRGRLGNQLCGTLSPSTAKQTVSCRGASAAMVELKMPRKDYLSLCEVKVYGRNSRKVPPPRYLGCFQDHQNRDLKHGPNKQGYSPASCAVACAKYKYFAVQAGGECRCDNSYSTPSNTYPRKPDSECNYRRKGYGGGWRNAVYTSGKAKKEQCQRLTSGNGRHLKGMKIKLKGTGVATLAFGNCGHSKVQLLVDGAVQDTVRQAGHSVKLVKFSPGTEISLRAGKQAEIALESIQVDCVQDVKHLGDSCKAHCHGVSGPCDYCGTEAACCQKGSGDFRAGCDGRLGTNRHTNVCVPKSHRDNALDKYVDKALSIYAQHLYPMYKWAVADKRRALQQKPLNKEQVSRNTILERVAKVVKKARRAAAHSTKVVQNIQALHGRPMKALMKALESRMPRLRSIDVGAVEIPWKDWKLNDGETAPSVPTLKVCFTEIGCQSRTAPKLTQLDDAVKGLAYQVLDSWVHNLIKLQTAKILFVSGVKYAKRKVTPWSFLLHSKKKKDVSSQAYNVTVPEALKTSSVNVTFVTALHKDKFKAFVESKVQHVPAGFVVPSSSNNHSEADKGTREKEAGNGAREEGTVKQHAQD